MNYINVGKENSGSIDLYYEDHGHGKPVVLIHGWPLSGESWEKQTTALVKSGYRVITYDRRGFGRSSRPASGYDYDTLASDLDKVLLKLNLCDVTLVGFSMGGGEIARYISKYGSERISDVVFISAIQPYLLKTPDNPEGVDSTVFDGIKKALSGDRLAFLTSFLNDFYNFDILASSRVSIEVIRNSWKTAASASPVGTLECVSSWAEDFREDLSHIDVPTLVIHGDDDRIVPLAASGGRMPSAIPGSRLVVVKGGPHGLIWTHSDEVNRALVEFIGIESEMPFRRAA